MTSVDSATSVGSAPSTTRVHFGELMEYEMADRERVPLTLLADPIARPARHTIISVDDHLIEPPDMFEGRFPSALAERAPRVVEVAGNRQVWLYEGELYQETGLGAVKGRPPEEWNFEPTRFDEMRRGCWDIHERVRDMDINGVWASLCFPSAMAGFAGRIFSTSRDPELGLASVRAWNDWHIEVWAGGAPDRIIPLQIAWLGDPSIAADDIRRNAERGFKAVSFPERLDPIGLPPVQDTYWDPFLAACAETETVVCLHSGSSSWRAIDRVGLPIEIPTTLFPVNSAITTVDWLWSKVPVRFPAIKIALSEGGIGWVPMLLDRLDYVQDHSGRGALATWNCDLSPTEVVQRNFWFCTIDDPSTMELRHRIGIDHIMLEVDYPHADSTWPDTQSVVDKTLGHLPPDELAKITHLNAAELFRHPLPPRPVADAR